MLSDANDLVVQVILTTRRHHQCTINQPLPSGWCKLLSKLCWLVPAHVDQVVIRAFAEQATARLFLPEAFSLGLGLVEGIFP